MNDNLEDLKRIIYKVENSVEKVGTDNAQQNVQIAKLEMIFQKHESELHEIERQGLVERARIELAEKMITQLDKGTVEIHNDFEKSLSELDKY